MRGMREVVAHMLATINEMGDVARLGMGQTLQLEREDVAALARRVVEEYGMGPLSGPDAPRVEIDAPAEAIVTHGDPYRLLRVLHNLIGNAVKYSAGTQARGAPVHVEARAREGWAVIVVTDGGVGIPADELPRVFTRFFRASTSRGVKGTGIGLSGSRSIVEQHGGSINIESMAGQRTTVTMRLPLM